MAFGDECRISDTGLRRAWVRRAGYARWDECDVDNAEFGDIISEALSELTPGVLVAANSLYSMLEFEEELEKNRYSRVEFVKAIVQTVIGIRNTKVRVGIRHDTILLIVAFF